MINSTYYLIDEAVARRTSSSMSTAYRSADGRFIVEAKFLSRIPVRTSEYVTGVSGITPISESEALTLIAQNNYKMGYDNHNGTVDNEDPIPESRFERAMNGMKDASAEAVTVQVNDAESETVEEEDVTEAANDEHEESAHGNQEEINDLKIEA